MFGIRLDMREFERKAAELGGIPKQIPYALSRSLNQAAVNTQTALIASTWPRAVKVRNSTFMRAALRRVSSTKRNLRVEIADALGRGSLKMHATGGTKTPKRAHLAIPVGVKRGAHGVPASKRPAFLIANTPKRALRITDDGIFVGKGGRLWMMYNFQSSTPQPKDVPFYEDFELLMSNEVRTNFPRFFREAMQTAR